MNTPTVLSARNLRRTFGSFVAVEGLSIDIYKGEIFGFLGANGAGKTTAMKMLCGLLEPSGGTASVAGYDVATQTEQVKRSIGYMSQRFSLYDDLTVEENLRFWGKIYGLRSQQLNHAMASALQTLRLEEQRKKLVGGLPLGWKQKLAFAAAQLHEPSIVFLDEPTGGVDPATRRTFWELIYAGVARGTTVFITTHYMDEAMYCNRISMMVDGALVALASPAALLGEFSAATMDEVFVAIARRGARQEGL